MRVVEGNLFDSDAELLIHQVNCMGIMGSGVAKELKMRYPEVEEEYRKLCKSRNSSELLGEVQFCKTSSGQWIANLFGQEHINPTWYIGGKVTDYEALDKAFAKIAEFMSENNLSSAAVPYKMSCVRGGGKWDEVVSIIEQHTNKVTAYRL